MKDPEALDYLTVFVPFVHIDRVYCPIHDQRGPCLACMEMDLAYKLVKLPHRKDTVGVYFQDADFNEN